MARYRTVKPEFWSNDQVLDLSIPARLAFIGMWNFCDDTGRHKASPKALRAEVFPGDDNMSVGAVHDLVVEMMEAGLVDEYQDAAGAYVWQVTGWHHQKIDRPGPAKYGEKPEGAPNDPRPFAERSPNARRTLAPEGKVVEGSGGEGRGTTSCAEPDKPASTLPPFIRLPLAKNGDEAEIHTRQIDDWREAYPGVDIEQALRNMRQWLIHNPTKRKTNRGIGRFITSWLAKEQDRGGSSRAPPAQKRSAVDDMAAALGMEVSK